MRFFIHLILHFLVPLWVAKCAFGKNWRYPFFIMAMTILIDLDHLLANPVLDPQRCSIWFHALHGNVAIGAYLFMLIIPATRVVGTGLMIHIALDALDGIHMVFF